MRSAVTIAVTVLALAGTAAAQPALAPPGLTPAVPVAQPAQPAPPSHDDEVSEGTALAIALGGTAVSYGMLILGAKLEDAGDGGQTLATVGAVGTLIAPSAGRWYARSGGWRGLGLRLAGVGTAALAVAVALSECGLFSEHSCNPAGGVVLGVAAAGLYVGGTIDDIVMAPRDARQHNERLHQVALVPLVRPDHRGLGLAVAARF
jgi:hypothetical protein